MKVKITNPVTCKIIYQITKDMYHYGKCPIVMDKDKWLSIRPCVRWEKEQRINSGDGVMDTFNDVFGQFFGKR